MKVVKEPSVNNPMKYTDPSGYIRFSMAMKRERDEYSGYGGGSKLNNWALLSNSFHTPDDIFLSPSNYIPSSFTGMNFSINDILQKSSNLATPCTSITKTIICMSGLNNKLI